MRFSFKEGKNELIIYDKHQEIAVIKGKTNKDNKTKYFLSNFDDDKQLNIVATNLLQMSPNEYSANLYLMFFEYNDFLSGHIYIEPNNSHLKINLSFDHDVSKWNNPFTIDELNKCLCNQLVNMDYIVDDKEFFSINIQLKISKQEEITLDELIESHSNRIEKAVEEEKVKLANISLEKTLVKIFNFPDEYRNICSQYLMWFGEFLKNLGIDANVATQNNQRQTTIIVAPEKNSELLTKVEKLFYQYIQLPNCEVLPKREYLTPQEMYAYQSAIMQVQHLNTQIQMKDSVIASYQATNKSLMDQVEQANKPILMDSLKDEKKYEFFNGALKIPAKQTLGKNGKVEIDLSKIFKSN